MEFWKQVPTHEAFYEASTYGRVRRISTRAGNPLCRLIAPGKKPNGYLGYALCSHGKVKHVLAHRLIVETFIGPIPRDLCVNHRNGNKADNILSNLEVATYSENMAHAVRELAYMPPRGEQNGATVLTEDNVREIRKLYATGLMQLQIAERFGVSEANIGCIVRGETWAHLDDCIAILRRKRHKKAKLTEERVRAIRDAHAIGFTQRQVAERFGISSATASLIIRRMAWAHVE